MSKIAIKGNDSGSATFTIEAPATSTDRTLTLPDEAGTVLTSASTVAESQMFSGFANGITELDQWRLSQSFNGPSTANQNQVINNYWERNDRASFSKIGTGLTESGGVFTYPTTGVYMIMVTFCAQCTDNNVARYFYTYTETSDDSGSNYLFVTSTLNSLPNATSSTDFATTTTTSIVNVTDASTFRTRFSITTDSTNLQLAGDTTQNQTHFTFMRIGDAQ